MTVIEKLDMNVKQVNSDFAAIKNKIVEKGVEVADGTRTADYASKIEEVYSVGFEDSEENIAYLNEKLEQTLYSTDTGGKNYYDEFWDSYQANGTRYAYYSVFCGPAWNDKTFFPKYNITMSYSGRQAFLYNSVTDLTARLIECGIVLDTQQCTDNVSMFQYASTKTLPMLDFSSIKTTGNTFSDCTKLENIEKIIIGNNYPATTTLFTNCKKLREVRFEGTFVNNFGVGPCIVLSRASIENIVNCLSSSATGKTLTISQTAVDGAFTPDEWAALMATKSNWTFTMTT